MNAAVESGPLAGLMHQIWQSCSELFAAAVTVADTTSTFSMSTTSGILGALWPLSLRAGVLVAGCVFVARLLLLLAQRRRGLVGAAVGPVKYGVAVTATAGCVSGLLGITDAATGMLLHQVLHRQSFRELIQHLPLTADAVSGVSSVTLGLVGLFGLVPAAFGYAVEMIYRQVAIVVLVATVPITAAGLLARSTARWWTTLRWLLTATLMKPALVLVLAVALGPLVGAHGLFGLLGAVAVSWVALGCPWALYRLLIFMVPAVEPGGRCHHYPPGSGGCAPSEPGPVAACAELSASPSRTRFAPVGVPALLESVGLAGDVPLPDVLAGLQFRDGPRFRGHGHIGVIHDSLHDRWAATATVSLPPNGLDSGSWCSTLAATLGTVLSWPTTTGHHVLADQVSLLIRTIPYQAPDIIHPGPSVLALRRIPSEDHAVTEVMHEVFVTISGSETALRRPAQAAGGGISGRAWAVYRLLDALHQALTSVNASLTWLSSASLAGALGDAITPTTAALPDQAHSSAHYPGARAPQCAQATPAASPELSGYTHGDVTTLTYTVAPEPGTSLDDLTALLANPSPRERRCLSVHLHRGSSESTSLPQHRARPSAPGALKALLTASRWPIGSLRSPRHSPARTQLAAGDRPADNPPPRAPTQTTPGATISGPLTATVFAAMTMPAHQPIDDPAACLEHDAAARFQLTRAQAQDTAFATACLPVGLPGHRSARR